MATMNSGLGGAAGYGENSMKALGVDSGNLDDGSKLVDITSVFGAGGIDFYGSSYTGIHINTNGLITFTGPELAYTPIGLSGYSDPAIAPLWTDIDISQGGDIYWDIDPVGGAVTITWLDVAPFTGSGEVNSFQLVLSDLGGGDFSVEFIYDNIEWATQGDGSGSPIAATAGITDGGSNDFVIPGSGNEAALLNYPTTDFGNGDPSGTYSLNVTNGTVPCLARGTRVETDRGMLAVEDIRVGDCVLTLDHGLRPVQWIGQRQVLPRHLARREDLRPVIIRKSALGNSRKMLVSQQHAFLIQGRLVRAKHLVAACGGKVARFDKTQSPVAYFHILTPEHNLIRAEGVWTETLFPGGMALSGLDSMARLSLLAARPDIRESSGVPVREYATGGDIRRGDVVLRHGQPPLLGPMAPPERAGEARIRTYRDQGYRAARRQES